ncbi:uncharacterized protein LOC108102130 [Drosophila ficusphila]|uniref:uncharacterized protein LOC108102130 n=1 Tax=Drosophila ficusphila TaxID=30025 RepID=UPI0007E6FC54|nr:uncharacterized protein LOC108102130 [Drosophila ficusphila]
MCSSVGLVVEGISLGSGRQFTPRLTMKREYNTKCFRPERYRHEVANHYRDYKLQQHVGSGSGHESGHSAHRRRRRRNRLFFAPAVSTSLASGGSAQFRDVWPTHVHYFPRSDDTTYASRGRRTVCSGEPPDDTYNDAVRRIRSAHSCEQLRHLVHRIPWRSKCRSASSNAVPVAPAHGSQTSETSDTSDRRVRVNYKPNINKWPAESLQKQQKQQQQQQPPVDFYGYLQLASGYYERGLQANIKYLQSIGQRQCNAISPVPGLFLDAVQRGESPVQKLTGRLVSLLKSLRRKAAKSAKTAKTAKEKTGDPVICVKVKQQKEEREPGEEELLDNSEEGPAEQSASMCDYYATDCTATQSGEATASEASFANSSSRTVAQATSAASAASTASGDHRRLYEIIDNLGHLGIGDATGSRRQQQTLKLPQISFTDCTAQQVAPHCSSFNIVRLQIPNEARPPNLGLRARRVNT